MHQFETQMEIDESSALQFIDDVVASIADVGARDESAMHVDFAGSANSSPAMQRNAAFEQRCASMFALIWNKACGEYEAHRYERCIHWLRRAQHLATGFEAERSDERRRNCAAHIASVLLHLQLIDEAVEVVCIMESVTLFAASLLLTYCVKVNEMIALCPNDVRARILQFQIALARRDPAAASNAVLLIHRSAVLSDGDAFAALILCTTAAQASGAGDVAAEALEAALRRSLASSIAAAGSAAESLEVLSTAAIDSDYGTEYAANHISEHPGRAGELLVTLLGLRLKCKSSAPQSTAGDTVAPKAMQEGDVAAAAEAAEDAPPLAAPTAAADASSDAGDGVDRLLAAFELNCAMISAYGVDVVFGSSLANLQWTSDHCWNAACVAARAPLNRHTHALFRCWYA